jgi:DNA replication protein DnaC
LAGLSQKGEEEHECPKCKDLEGFIIRQDDGSEVWRFCECRERKIAKKRAERLMKSSRITEEFKKLSFSNFYLEDRPDIVIEAFNCARQYVSKFSEIRKGRLNSIALLGHPGSGKTHLLVAIANHLLAQGVGVIYFPWVEGMNDLKADFDQIEKKVEQLKKTEVLFIDDLFKGRRQVTDWQLEQLFEIINYRYLNHLPILISSEKGIDDICDIDEGVGSRILEMCTDYTVVLKGDRKELNYRLPEEAV